MMLKDGIPEDITKLMYYINSSACTVRPPYRINEIDHMIKALIHKGDFEDVINRPRPMSSMYNVKGVPQGAPTSPVLSLLGLHNSVFDRPGIETLMYADDGLYYGDIANTPLITPNTGIAKGNIRFHPDKSS